MWQSSHQLALAYLHRADAVRILDFAHAAEYISAIGQAVQAAGGRLPAHWLEGVLHRLKHQGAESIWPGWPPAIPAHCCRRN